MRISIYVKGMKEGNARLQPWRYFNELALGLRARGHEVLLQSKIATSASPDPASGPAFRGSDPDVALWGVSQLSVFRRPPAKGVTRNVAVLGSPLYRPKDLLRLGWSLTGSPRAYGIHVLNAFVPRRRFATYLDRHFDSTVVMARYSADQLTAAGHNSEKLHVLPPGRDRVVADSTPTHTDAVTFVYAGPPTPIRGVDVLIEAFAKCAREQPTIRLELLLRIDGEQQGGRISALRDLVDSLGVSSKTTFVVGKLTPADVQRHLDGADVVVLPFRLVPSEAPLTVMEAAAAGKPLISTRLAPIRALAAPGSYLVVPGSVSRLAQAIRVLASDGEKRALMAAKAREHYVRLPTWDEVINEFEALAKTPKPTVGSFRLHSSDAPKTYASVSSPILRLILRTTPGRMASHWTFQGVIYMDPTERMFKLGADLVATCVFIAITRPYIRSLGSRAALGFVAAHSLNFALNSHALAAMKWRGQRFGRETTDAFIPDMARRLGSTRGVQGLFVYGSLSRGQGSDSSDLDVRVLRQPGPWNGFWVCMAVAKERFLALLKGVPLDIFVWDSIDRATSMRADEQPFDLLGSQS